MAQAARALAAYVAEGKPRQPREAPALAEDAVGGRVARERRVVLEDAAVVDIRDVEVPRPVHRDATRKAQAVRAHAVSARVRDGGEAPALAEDAVGGRVAGERRV